MDYKPFCGYWFYGGSGQTALSRAAFYCSWGLLAVAPVVGFIMTIREYTYRRFRDR
jgi:hypothetical protein